MGIINKTKNYFAGLAHFDRRIVISMSVICFLIFGIFDRMIDIVQYTHMTDDLHLNTNKKNYFGAIKDSPYSATAMFVMFSEIYPLFGYKKRYYMVISGVIGMFASAWIAVNYHPGGMVYLIAICIFLVVSVGMVFNVMMQAKSLSIIRKHTEYGAHLMTWISFLTTAGSVLGNFVGIWVQYLPPFYIYVWAIPMIAFPTLIVALGFFPEKKREMKLNKELLIKKKSSYILAVVICVFSLTVTFVKTAIDSYIVDICLGVVTVYVFILAYFLLKNNFLLWRIYFFAFLYDAMYVRYYSPRNAYYIQDLSKCLDHTPRFDKTFYFTYSKFSEKLAALLGPVVFQIFFRKIDIRYTILFQWVSRLLLVGTDLLIVSGIAHNANLSEKGIFITHSVMDGVSHTLRHLAYVAMGNYVNTKTPNNMIIPLIYSFNSLGYTFSKAIGGSLTKYFGIRETKNNIPCDFSGYIKLALISSALCPVINLVSFWFIVPGFRTSDFKETGKRPDESHLIAEVVEQTKFSTSTSSKKSNNQSIENGSEKIDTRSRIID